MIVGLVGAGNMARALARGWAAAEPALTRSSSATPTRSAPSTWPTRSAARAVGSNRDLAEAADTIVLAMKPDALVPVAEETCGDRSPSATCRSSRSSARRRISAIEQAFGPGTAVLRFMPNVAAEVRAGDVLLRAGHGARRLAPRASLLDLFGLLGELVPVEERLMDVATAISGCGPAFFALVVGGLTDAGVEQGLDARQAARLAVTHDGRHGGAAAQRAGTMSPAAAPGDVPGRRDGGGAGGARGDRRARRVRGRSRCGRREGRGGAGTAVG